MPVLVSHCIVERLESMRLMLFCGFVVNVVLWFVCVNLRDQPEILGFLLCGLFEYSHVNILPQIAQITQRNAASCIITQRKTVW